MWLKLSHTVNQEGCGLLSNSMSLLVSISRLDSLFYVLIKQYKTDPFRQGCTLVLGRTGKILCPVSSLMAFLVTRGSQSGPLFTFQDGSYLTRARFVQELKRALTTSGIDADKYNGHSFSCHNRCRRTQHICCM